MGGGGDGGAAAARAQENRRQALAAQEAQQVRNIFEGGSQTLYSPVATGTLFDPSTQYYSLGGGGKFSPAKSPGLGSYTVVKPGSSLTPGATYFTRKGNATPYNPRYVGSNVTPTAYTYSPVTDGSKLNSLLAAGQLFSRPLKADNLFTASTSTQPGYGPDFYNKVKQDYINYAMPQFNTQLGQQQQSLLGSLADRGLLTSSTATQQSDLLNAYANMQKQNIIDTGTGNANQLKQQMQNQENNLVSQVLASSDPASAAAGALQTASTYAAPPALQPLGNLFQNFANAYLVSQAAQPAPTGSPYSYYAPGGYNPFSLGMSTGYLPKQ